MRQATRIAARARSAETSFGPRSNGFEPAGLIGAARDAFFVEPCALPKWRNDTTLPWPTSDGKTQNVPENSSNWVKMRRTSIEHILSALPPLATEERTFGIGSSVPKPVVSNRSKGSALFDHSIT